MEREWRASTGGWRVKSGKEKFIRGWGRQKRERWRGRDDEERKEWAWEKYLASVHKCLKQGVRESETGSQDGEQQPFCAAPHGLASLPPALPRITMSPNAVTKKNGECERKKRRGCVHGWRKERRCWGGVQVKPAFVFLNWWLATIQLHCPHEPTEVFCCVRSCERTCFSLFEISTRKLKHHQLQFKICV